MSSDPIAELERAIDAVGVLDPFVLSDRVSIVRLERVQAKLDAAVTAAVASFDESAEWALSGAKNAAAWLSTQCHLAPKEARAQVRRGRRLRLMVWSARRASETD